MSQAAADVLRNTQMLIEFILPFSVDLYGSGTVCLRNENLRSVQSRENMLALLLLSSEALVAL